MSAGLESAFEVLGIQNVRTLDAATNMALRGAHFKHEGTPIWLVQLATCGSLPIVEESDHHGKEMD